MMKLSQCLCILFFLCFSCTPEVDIHSPASAFYQQQEDQALLDVAAEVFPPSQYTYPHPPLSYYISQGRTKHEWLLDSTSNANHIVNVYLLDTLVSPKAYIISPHGYKHLKRFAGKKHYTYLDSTLFQGKNFSPGLFSKLKNTRGRITSYRRAKDDRLTKKGAELFIISRVLFNHNFSTGLIYREDQCYGDCGGGIIYQIEKRANKWVVASRKVCWVS